MRFCGRRGGRPARHELTGEASILQRWWRYSTATGSVNAAAKASGISHASARRLLVDKGLISKDRQPYGKAGGANADSSSCSALGWSAGRAAREVGVNERTARDWRDGIRKVGNTRIRPDGTVIHYSDSMRGTHSR